MLIKESFKQFKGRLKNAAYSGIIIQKRFFFIRCLKKYYAFLFLDMFIKKNDKKILFKMLMQ